MVSSQSGSTRVRKGGNRKIDSLITYKERTKLFANIGKVVRPYYLLYFKNLKYLVKVRGFKSIDRFGLVALRVCGVLLTRQKVNAYESGYWSLISFNTLAGFSVVLGVDVSIMLSVDLTALDDVERARILESK